MSSSDLESLQSNWMESRTHTEQSVEGEASASILARKAWRSRLLSMYASTQESVYHHFVLVGNLRLQILVERKS